MFYLVGIGLQAEHISLEAQKTVKKCRKVFLDSYTNYFPSQQIKETEKLLKKKVTVLNRRQIEEGFTETLEEARKKNIAVLVPGNPLTATTHVQLLIEAKKLGVPFCFVPGISITDFLGWTGLDAYRFGRITTIVAPKENFSPESFFDVIQKNISANCHTLCLLEFDAEKNFALDIPTAIRLLESIGEKRGTPIIKDSVLVGMYGIAGKKQKIVSGKAGELKGIRSSVFPQSLVVCSELNEKEKEAIGALAGNGA